MKRMEISSMCSQMGVTVRREHLPGKMRGFATQYRGGYLVLIEASMGEPEAYRTLLHEMIHIMEGHLERDIPVDEMESIVADLLPQMMDDYDFDRIDPVEDIEEDNPY